MSTQSEAALEAGLITTLQQMDYEYVQIVEEDNLYANFKRQLEVHNRKRLEEYGRNEPYTTYQYNLESFREIKRYLMYREQIGMVYFAINLLGNVVVFMPFGFLVPVLYREQRKGVHFKGHYFRSGLFVTFLGFAFSLVVETIQLVTKVGCFDVDDLCLNTFGVILGYICYYLSKKIIRALGRK